MVYIQILKELDEQLKDSIAYPNGVCAIKRRLDIQAFYPGGIGYISDNPSAEPKILVLGKDFSTINEYDLLKSGHHSELNGPTWRNIFKVFGEAGVDINKCFFSNVYMGLRDSDKMTGHYAPFHQDEYEKDCLMFLQVQINLIKPKLVITLGKYAAEMLSNISDSLSMWRGYKALNLEDKGYITDVKVGTCEFDVVALAHTSMRHLNIKNRSYKQFKGHDAEIEMLKAANIKLSQ